MKLHLPKQLFTALLTAITISATPAAYALTLTDGYHKTYSLEKDFSYMVGGKKVEYKAETGFLDGYDMNAKNLTLNMATSWDTDQVLFIVNPGTTSASTSNSSVGLNATAGNDLDAIAGGNLTWETGAITKDELGNEGNQTSITLKINKNGTTITSASGAVLYTKNGLKYGSGPYNKTYLNNGIISAIVVSDVADGMTGSDNYYASNFTGTWEQQFSKMTTETVSSRSEITSHTDFTNKDAIVVGSAGQLWLNAESSSLELSKAVNIYIGNTSYQNANDEQYNLSAIRLNNENDIKISGNLYIVDNAAMISTAGKAITFEGSVTDKVLNNAGKTVSTDSTLSLSGTGYNFTGAVDVHGLHIAAGAQAAFNNLKVDGILTNDGTLTNNGTLVLNSTVQGSGTVKNGEQGRIKLGAYTLNLFDNVTYVDGGNSGFVDSLTVFSNPVGYTGKVYVDNVDTVGYDVSEGTIILGGGSKTYYVNEANHTATDAADATAFFIKNGASLNTVNGISAKLAGSGTYVLGKVTKDTNDSYHISTAKLGSLIMDESNWSGTVEIAGNSEEINFNDLGQAGSTVKIQADGFTGYLNSSADNVDSATEYTPHIELAGNLTIDNAYTGHHYIFLGDISGTGKLVKKTTSGNNQHYHFRGDLTNWTGSITNDANTTTHVYLESNVDTVGASINKGSGTLNLTVNTESAAILNNTVSVNTLTLNQSATFNKSLTVSDTATIAANNTLTLGTGDHTISSLTLNSASVVETAFGSANKSVTVNSLTVANGASATLGTQQSNTHNGYFNIKQLKGNGSTLILSNGSKTSLSSVFALGENQGAATFSGTLILQSNYENADANRGLVLNICNSDVLTNTVLELKGTSASDIKERVGIGLNQDTTIGGIKDNADNAPLGSYIQSGIFVNNYNFNTVPSSSPGDETVTLTIATNQDYSTSANILDKVNLQKTGTGAQTFSGDMSKFNGDITVIGGKLSFTNSAGFTTSSATVSDGTELALGGDTTIDQLSSVASVDGLAGGSSLTLGDNVSLSITKLEIGRTITVSRGEGAELFITNLSVSEEAVLDGVEGESAVAYLSSLASTQGSKDGNGYKAFQGKWILIKGYEWTGTQDNVSYGNGNTYLTFDDYVVLSSIYYVQQGTVTLGTQATTGVEDATGFNVSKGATLAVAALPSGWNTTDMLTGKVTGDGRIQFTSDITVNHGDTITTFGGELEVTGAGTELTVEGEQSNYVDLSSLSNIVVNNWAQITYHATPQGREEGITTPHLQKLSVESGTGIFHFKDSDEGKTLYIGEVSIHAGATMQMTSSWQDSPITIQKLTTGGEGTDVSKLEVYSPGGDSASSGVVNIQSLKDFSGELIFIKNSDKSLTATVNTGLEGADFKSLMVTNSNGTMGFTFNVQGDTSIDLVSLDSGTVTIYEGKTLTLGNGVDASTHNIGTLNAGEGASITLNTGATLNAFTKGTGTVTLKGSGIYNLGRNTATYVSGLDQATWTGTVKINDTELSIADLSTFGNANSTISVRGITGKLPTQTIEQTIQSHIILEPVSTASCFDLDGDSAANLTFTGKISGSGNMGTAKDSATGHKITFAGDVTDWTGIYWASQASTITYSGNAKVINNEITAGEGKTSTVLYKNTTGMIVNGNINNQQWTNGTLNLQILNENNATGKVVFTGAVVKGTTNLTVEENASAEFTNASVKLNTVDVKEGATLSFATLNAQSVTNSGALNLGTAATITKAERATAATMSKVQMSSSSISSAATDSTLGSISHALIDLQKAAEFSISDMSLSNVSLKAAATGTELNLNNVTAEAVQLAAGQFTLGGEVALSEQTPATKSGGYTASFTTGQLNGITLNNANGAASLTVDLGELPDCLQDGKTYNITIALSGFSMAAYDGTDDPGLLFAADSWLGKLLADQGASRYVSSGDVESATTLAANNNAVTVTYTAMTDGNVGTIITITGLTIPEPTTSTLSLLALAGLAARRRRQH